jgi:hypothetical protein
MGGRIAEDMVFSEISTGAQNDIEQATEMARKMVCEWGMSETLGPLTYGKKEEQIFLGKEFNRHQDYSEATALKIDAEIKRIVSEQYDTRREKTLSEQRDALVRIAEALLEARGPGRRAAHADRRGKAHGHPIPTRDAAPSAAREGKVTRERAGGIFPPMAPEADVRRGAWRPRAARAPRRGASEGGDDRAPAGRTAGTATAARRGYRLTLRGEEAVLGERTWVMGVLNVTPDSFSDGGRFQDAAAAWTTASPSSRRGRTS